MSSSLEYTFSYNVDHVCRYHRGDLFTSEEHNVLTEDEQMYVRDVLYQEDLANAFGTTPDVFMLLPLEDLMVQLHEQVAGCALLMEGAKLAGSHLFTEDPVCGLCALCSYDYFMLTHDCVVHWIRHGNTDHQCFEELMEILTKHAKPC